MSASKTQLLKSRWTRAVDSYLNLSDRVFQIAGVVQKSSVKVAKESALVQPGSRALIRFTVLGIVITFMFVLFSCRAPNTGRGRPPTPEISPARLEKSQDPLYIKRETLNVKPKDPGSKTGSIWADSSDPRTLFSEFKPTKMGDVVTVNIPDDLQFKWPGLSSPGAKSKDDKGSKDSKDSKKEGGGDTSKASADLAKVGETTQAIFEPVKRFKMEIVAIDTNIYLRGVRNFKGKNGEQMQIGVFAKVPRRVVNSFEIDARELTEVAVSENSNGAMSDYGAPGWDVTVSRKLSGFNPDVTAEMAALEGVRNELVTFQKSLEERQKALNDETERLKKDRERLTKQSEGKKDEGTPKDGEKAAAGDQPKAEESGGNDKGAKR